MQMCTHKWTTTHLVSALSRDPDWYYLLRMPTNKALWVIEHSAQCTLCFHSRSVIKMQLKNALHSDLLKQCQSQMAQ